MFRLLDNRQFWVPPMFRQSRYPSVAILQTMTTALLTFLVKVYQPYFTFFRNYGTCSGSLALTLSIFPLPVSPDLGFSCDGFRALHSIGLLPT